MAVGVPVIASNVGGIPSMIQDGINGLLFEKGNIKSLVSKIKILLFDPKLAQTISRNAKDIANARNRPDKVATQTVKIYKEIILKK
jgi:glycosyltransferase involved in cell wall biosynthesis